MWYVPWHSFQLFGLTIQVWGMMLAFGVVLGWWLFDYNLLWRRMKIDSTYLVFGFVLGALLSARAMDIIANWSFYRDYSWWQLVSFWQGGMSSYGAIGFGIIYIWLVSRRYKEQALDFFDATANVLLLALFVARNGCFMISDHLGKLSNGWLAINIAGEFRQPIALYYLALDLVLFALASWLFYTGRLRGRLLWLIMVLFGLTRPLLDWLFKDFQGNALAWQITLLGGLVMIGVGLVGLRTNRTLTKL